MAVRNIDSLLEKVANGTEVVIDSPDSQPIFISNSPVNATAVAGYDEWYESQITEALNDDRPDLSSDELNTRAEQRCATALKRTSGATA